MRHLALLFSAVLFRFQQALACPVCSTSAGRQVRAGIFNADFIPTALMVLAPFAVFVGIILLLHVGVGRGRPQMRDAGAEGVIGDRHEQPSPDHAMEVS